ncbi:hypothetical protein GCM10011506_12960 [Marivirga lumbricoides]|uniref:PPM-type phosphatase domain-containing protein n=1 Tax=Marivirga lumbricoides TaxID=1046115 RepID=A0ABQ1LVA8_9BACT|nr:hypothetical protein GCM10011506_12960 [Marivirga lumbricoides]
MRLLFLTGVLFFLTFKVSGQEVSTDELLAKVDSVPDSTKIEIYLDVAIAFRILQSDKAVEYASNALAIAVKNGNHQKQAESLHILGSTYIVLGNYTKATSLLHEALQMYELTGKRKGVANTSNTLGIFYFEQKDYKNALKYYEKAKALVDSAIAPGSYATYQLNIGEVYQAMGQNEKASDIEKNALTTFKLVGDIDGMAYANGVLAKIKFREGNYEAALRLCEEALALFNEAQDHLGAVEYLHLLAKIHIKLDKIDRAKDYAMAALELSNQISTLRLKIASFNILADISIKEGNYFQAYQYKDSFVVLKDSLMDVEKQKNITNLRILNESSRKEQENELLRVEQQLQVKKIEEQRIINISVLGALLLIAIFALITFRSKQSKQRANTLLRKQNEEILMQREEIEAQSEGLKFINREVINKNKLIEEKNKNITDSINYAKRIQNALLPFSERIAKSIPEHFIFYKPKDIVSGDFYWFKELKDKVVIAVADCTGHGIPGAFMSFIGHDTLNHVINVKHITEPEEILKNLKNNIIHLLRQEENDNRDGMDISVCVWDRRKNIVEFAGANHSLLYIQNGKLFELKGNRTTIGFEEEKQTRTFDTKRIDITSDTMFYLFTDGYVDQFGSSKDVKFMKNRFRDLLLGIYEKKVETQEVIIRETMEQWMQNTEQIDDILVMGFRLYD